MTHHSSKSSDIVLAAHSFHDLLHDALSLDSHVDLLTREVLVDDGSNELTEVGACAKSRDGDDSLDEVESSEHNLFGPVRQQ